MKCEDFKKYFYDFHDHLLSNDLMKEMGSHIEECIGCREINKKYKNFLNRFSTLPKSIQPDRNLWENIKKRISIKKSFNFSNNYKFPAIAASFIIITLFSVLTFYNNYSKSSDTRILKQFNSASREYEKARKDLVSALHSKEGIINKDTIDIIENNLLIMDQAINEIKTAINKEPDNQRLVLMLADTYQKETNLLLSTKKLILNIEKSGG